MAAQNSIYDWVRDHRVHHKFSETDADPHNSKRGFFFAHVGWLMMKKHPDVVRKGKEIDMSDVLADPVVQFHEKYFKPLKLLFGFILPSMVPPLFWGEDLFWSIVFVCIFRYVLSLNFTWLVNSAAHIWGAKPYDKRISPSENLTVSILSMGEGWHNYHHTFPWDYKTAELGRYTVNLTTFWIDVFAKIGWAYDLKTPSKTLVENVIRRHGDGTHPLCKTFLEVPSESTIIIEYFGVCFILFFNPKYKIIDQAKCVAFTYNTMPPNSTENLTEDLPVVAPDDYASTKNESLNYFKDWDEFKVFFSQLKWFNITLISIIHGIFLWGIFAFPWLHSLRLILWVALMIHFTGLGVGAGAHRLWCHRSYKAKLPLRIFLMLCYSIAGHNPLFYWVRDHRVHHRFTDTDADPHNSKRGFFYSHVGWLFMKKHSEVLRRGKEVDMSDLWEDPVIRFHQKYYIILTILLGFVIPTCVPPLLWGQDWYWSILTVCVGRYVLVLNFTWFVNSAAHMWGTKPFDRSISPTENKWVSVFTFGEGWHNYHHTFPWDYKAAELDYLGYNGSGFFIDLCAKLGLAYDLKTASPELIQRVVEKGGDGTHPVWGHLEVPYSDEQKIKKELKLD
ncbi:hypothetical protein RN001_006529 [Aquatica leii]|uniref:Fatty acid desaturase domain-containing protein n=1 Tax=Aquatica leii TaxID=1421715 RepID=A0AAN7P878_9COLE|nr:hypothetical protein RN001_006529 [Aquatica leii]